MTQEELSEKCGISHVLSCMRTSVWYRISSMITGSIELLDMAIGNLLDDDVVGGLGGVRAGDHRT